MFLFVVYACLVCSKYVVFHSAILLLCVVWLLGWLELNFFNGLLDDFFVGLLDECLLAQVKMFVAMFYFCVLLLKNLFSNFHFIPKSDGAE